MAYRIVLRRDTSTNWTTNNPVLLLGEPGFETDTSRMKIGDGSTLWNDLPYYVGYDLLALDSDLIPATGGTYDLGATAGYSWRDLYLSGNTIYLGDATLSAIGSSVSIDTIILGGPTADGGVLLSATGGSLISNGNSLKGETGPTGPTGPSGSSGSNGPTGATGATGGVETTDRLISTNDLEVVLDSQGTLNTPLLLPTAFTAVCDGDHMIDPVGFIDDNWWEFEVEFAVNPNGSVETMINNIFPILTNPGYVSGYSFEFTEADHGIPGFTFVIQLNDVVLSGGAGWTANLSVSPPPIYPSTLKSLGAVKITSNGNHLIFGTDGTLTFPYRSSIKSIPNSAGDDPTVSTMVLKPDSSLSTDQYIVLDPTGPNHIHIRPGGTIDESNADLIIGGENNNLLISDVLNKVQIKTTDIEVEFIGYIDNGFAGASGSTLHVTDIISGTITDGMTIYGPGIPGGYTLQFGTVIAPQGNGGVGNYYLPGGDFLTTSSTYTGEISVNNWEFGGVGTLRFPDNSIQTTAYPGIPNLINSGPSAPGSAVVANPTNVNVNFSDGIGTAWSFGTTGLTFPDDTVQTTAYLPGYKVYTAILSQNGTGAPSANILENTIGNIVWSYSSAGNYLATLAGAFTSQKTFFYVSSQAGYNTAGQIYSQDIRTLTRITDGIVNLNQTNLNFTAGVFSSAGSVNDFANLYLEIRVYN